MDLRTRVKDAIDAAYLARVMKRDDLPPFSLRGYVGPIAEFEKTPAEYITYFKLLAGLQMDQRVLDIGCGAGRFALQLLERPNFFTGRYEGFDIDQRAVDWATKHIANQHSNVRFTHVDLYNKHYNPTGTLRPETFSFPYADDAFDFAFAMSVFTHVPSDVCENYLREIGRVLAPGGRALLSFALLPERVDQLEGVAIPRVCVGIMEACGMAEPGPQGKMYHLDGYSTLTPAVPEKATFYEQPAVEAMIGRTGLSVDAIHPGAWNRETGGVAFQDLVVLSQPT
ncbi:MAG: class I SAM-dependent methyltransferase [Acidimicrobiia bacterium]